MPSPKIIGIPDTPYCRPIAEAFQRREDFAVVRDSPAGLAYRLGKRGLDAAFLSPIDYARNASEYLIVPGVAVSSQGANSFIVLHFKQGSSTVRTLAVHPVSASDVILAKILLAELFGIDPQIVPVEGSLDTMLTRADSALLVGIPALESAASRPIALDLVEEWTNETHLPYVHGFWVTRENALTPPECETIASAVVPVDIPIPDNIEAAMTVPEQFSYGFAEDVREGIREFFRYAYYHGILPDVPDLRFYGSEEKSPPDPSLN